MTLRLKGEVELLAAGFFMTVLFCVNGELIGEFKPLTGVDSEELELTGHC